MYDLASFHKTSGSPASSPTKRRKRVPELPTPVQGHVLQQEIPQGEIPKLVHQVWIDKTGKNGSYPSRYEKYRSTISEMNPDFELRTWLEKDVLRVMRTNGLHRCIKAYRNMRYVISKADFSRMIILYVYGGIYLDFDFECKRPLSELLEKYKDNEIIITRETADHYEGRHKICVGFMAATPKHPFLLGWIERMVTNMEDQHETYLNVISTTGPIALYNYAEDSIYEWRKWLVPTRYILPHNCKGKQISEIDCNQLYDGPFLDTHWEEGTGWSNEIVYSVGNQLFKTYAAVGVAAIIILIFCIGWGGFTTRFRPRN